MEESSNFRFKWPIKGGLSILWYNWKETKMNKATKVTTALLGLTIAVKVESQSSLSVQNMPEVNMYEYEMLKSLAG